MATIALEAAVRMLRLIPDQPNAIQLYQICPWWCVLHYLMQATTVLLLELSFGNVHTPDEELNTLNTAKKGVRWLHAMSEESIASRRAWRLCDSCLRRIAIGMDYDLSDMPSSSPDEPQPQQQQPLQTESTNHPTDMVPDPILPAAYAAWSSTTTPISQPQPQPQQ